jgi:hypothetical protein
VISELYNTIVKVCNVLLNTKEEITMPDNEFEQPISIDFAPEGSLCEWCGKPAVEQLTVIGGESHNEGGYFCHECGEKFIRAVADPNSKVVSPEASAERGALNE